MRLAQQARRAKVIRMDGREYRRSLWRDVGEPVVAVGIVGGFLLFGVWVLLEWWR